jgi:hypothetical protein
MWEAPRFDMQHNFQKRVIASTGSLVPQTVVDRPACFGDSDTKQLAIQGLGPYLSVHPPNCPISWLLSPHLTEGKQPQADNPTKQILGHMAHVYSRWSPNHTYLCRKWQSQRA